jgi:hypothetical protein
MQQHVPQSDHRSTHGLPQSHKHPADTSHNPQPRHSALDNITQRPHYLHNGEPAALRTRAKRRAASRSAHALVADVRSMRRFALSDHCHASMRIAGKPPRTPSHTPPRKRVECRKTRNTRHVASVNFNHRAALLPQLMLAIRAAMHVAMPSNGWPPWCISIIGRAWCITTLSGFERCMVCTAA